MIQGKCRNCGADDGLHHYSTNQCPVGGREAPFNRPQEWQTSTFAPRFDPIIVTLSGGLVQDIENIPPGVTVIVRDYDVDGCTSDELDAMKQDENGDYYESCEYYGQKEN